tara:strand:+ start:2920 stop:3105 length:186 start_codon:yes stop_codon:yes gene_type:complete
MNTYSARVSFMTDEIEAESLEQVEAVLTKLLQQLGEVNTDLSWEDVDWDIFEVNTYGRRVS